MEILFENKLAIVACLKNESPYIEEWLEYHSRIGIDKFYLYDNDSEDRSELQKILAPWIDQKIVELTEFHGDYAQIPAYNDAVLKHRFDCKYLAFIDLDEFIVPKQNRELIEIIDSLFQTQTDPQIRIGGVGINWRNFGSNGQEKKLPGGVLERFKKRAPDAFRPNIHVKTITNPRRVNRRVNPHNVIYYIDNICVNENGVEVPLYFNEQNTVKKIQLNHYFTKSREEFMAKVDRGRPETPKKRDPKMFDRYQRDEVEDLTALNLFNQFFRFYKMNDDQSTIRDLKFMLAEENPNIELLLTCFHRAHSLKDQSQREKYESESLEKILKIQDMPIYESQLFLDTLPELLLTSTQYRGKIVNRGIELFKNLAEFYRQKNQFVEFVDYLRRRELLESIR